MERDVFYGLQQGNAALKEIHKEMSLEMVEKLMDETAEGIAYQKVCKPSTHQYFPPPPTCRHRVLQLTDKPY